MKIPNYSKVWALGHKMVEPIKQCLVDIEEKLDGSQISFGVFDGVLEIRSKNALVYGKETNWQCINSMFELAVDSISAREPMLYNGWIYRGEYLNKPKHNTLAYDRVPFGNIAIFDIEKGASHFITDPQELLPAIAAAGFEYADPIRTQLAFSEITVELLDDILQRTSKLGGTKIEGVVIKARDSFGEDGKMLCCKYVSEEFKESHKQNLDWKQGKEYAIALGQQYYSEARWRKAIQHLRERGELLEDPKDIGALIKEVNADILVECQDEIKERLFKHYWHKMSKEITRGLPGWYKDELAKAALP